MEEHPDNLPLVDRFHRAEHLLRELSEHIQQSLLPKLSELRHAGKVFEVAAVSDQELFDRMQAVFESDEFARGLHERLQEFLKSIEADVDRLLNPH